MLLLSGLLNHLNYPNSLCSPNFNPLERAHMRLLFSKGPRASGVTAVGSVGWKVENMQMTFRIEKLQLQQKEVRSTFNEIAYGDSSQHRIAGASKEATQRRRVQSIIVALERKSFLGLCTQLREKGSTLRSCVTSMS